MKKNLLIILFVVLAAVVGWGTGFLFLNQHTPFWKKSNEQIMAWLQQEYKLTPTQYASIKQAYEEFRPGIKAQFTQLRQHREALKKLEADKTTAPGVLAKAKADLQSEKEAIHAKVKAHIQNIASLMSPEQAPRYLKKMEELRQRRK